jgi:hypothetical protein
MCGNPNANPNPNPNPNPCFQSLSSFSVASSIVNAALSLSLGEGWSDLCLTASEQSRDVLYYRIDETVVTYYTRAFVKRLPKHRKRWLLKHRKRLRTHTSICYLPLLANHPLRSQGKMYSIE